MTRERSQSDIGETRYLDPDLDKILAEIDQRYGYNPYLDEILAKIDSGHGGVKMTRRAILGMIGTGVGILLASRYIRYIFNHPRMGRNDSHGLNLGTLSERDFWPYYSQPWPEIPNLAIPNLEKIRSEAPENELCIYGPVPENFTEEKVRKILQSYTSVLYPTGSPALEESVSIWIELPKNYRIDPRFALAFFIHESGAGTNPKWAGHMPNGKTTKNMGNIICSRNWNGECFNRFRVYKTWQEGIKDWCILMWAYALGMANGKPLTTVEQIVPVYAPDIENDTEAYILAIKKLVQEM